jgi:predicted nuclease with TOPRIM domain
MSAESGGTLQPLVEALRKKVKHIDSRVDDHEEELEALREENDHLQRRIEKLEDELGVGGDRF